MNSFESERLLFRPFNMEDAAAVYNFSCNKDVTRYTGDGGVVNSIDDAKRIITDVWFKDYKQYGYGRYALVDKSSNQVVGFAGLKYLNQFGEADLGYRFLPEFWGQGLGFEAALVCTQFAFSQLQLDQIVALVMPENIGSKRILEKLGFVQERVLEEDGEAFIFMRLTSKQFNESQYAA